MFDFCANNMSCNPISINQSILLVDQVTVCDSRYKDYKNSLEYISLKQSIEYKNNLTEYSKKEEVFTKTERNLENMKNQYYKDYFSIIVDGKKTLLLKPLVFFVEQDDTGYYLTNTDLNIIACGNTFENAEKDMYEEFVIQWELYANEEDDKLTSKARLIKKNLIESIKL